jgi:hypothetical protein
MSTINKIEQRRFLRFSVVLLVAAAVLLPMRIGAQESDPFLDMFSNPDMITEENIEEISAPLKENFLISEKVTIGGQYYFKAAADFRKAWDKNFSYSGVLQLSLDARPVETFRLFAKAETQYPFIDADANSLIDVEEALKIQELYADFDIAQAVYGRVGKQTIAWGVGRYFSPADVLNLTPIDLDDPDAERTGPVALKMHASGFLSNFYTYIIANEITSAADIAIAPKYETVLGSMELGVAGFYRYDMAPKLIAMATFPLGQVDLYTELVGAWGSDKTYADGSGGTYTIENSPVVQATLGFSYKYTDPLGNGTLSSSGQFWYNGEGYADPSLAILAKNDPRIVAKTILPGDLVNPDRYYSALNVSFSNIFKSSVTVSASWFSAFGGATGRITPSASYAFNEDFSLTAKLPINYGAAGAEFSPLGFQYAPTLEAKLFGNSQVSFAVPISLGTTYQYPFVLSLSLAKERF